jgi:hypothetical protein
MRDQQPTAPAPETAYHVAPDLLFEYAQLMRAKTHRDALEARAAASGVEDELAEETERQYRLRLAAYADRVALQNPGDEEFAGEALRIARELMAYDRTRPHLVSAQPGPDSPAWSGAERAYVRREYDAWGWA